MSEPRPRLYPKRPGDVPAIVPRRRATADETWAGLTASVTRQRDDDTFEHYAIQVECWIEGDSDGAMAQPDEPAHVPASREWVPTSFDPDGTPVFGLG